MLKRWNTAFDPTIEYVSHRYVWVLLPGLSLNLWNITALKAIGNLLGHFLKVDEACRLSSDKCLALSSGHCMLHSKKLNLTF